MSAENNYILFFWFGKYFSRFVSKQRLLRFVGLSSVKVLIGRFRSRNQTLSKFALEESG